MERTMKSGRVNVKAQPNSLKREPEEQLVEEISNNNKSSLKCIRRKRHARGSTAPVDEEGTKGVSDKLRPFLRDKINSLHSLWKKPGTSPC